MCHNLWSFLPSLLLFFTLVFTFLFTFLGVFVSFSIAFSFFLFFLIFFTFVLSLFFFTYVCFISSLSNLLKTMLLLINTISETLVFRYSIGHVRMLIAQAKGTTNYRKSAPRCSNFIAHVINKFCIIFLRLFFHYLQIAKTI
jgi:hypothetical protein